MIAQAQPNLVPCPSCNGDGFRIINRADNWMWHEREKSKEAKVRCLACRDTPGWVEAWRVCAKCQCWVDMCSCASRERNVNIVKVEGIQLDEKPTSGVKGVTWNASHKTWSVSISKGGKVYFLGEFPVSMLDLAKELRQKAENATVDQIPILRREYGKLRKERGGRAFKNRGTRRYIRSSASDAAPKEFWPESSSEPEQETEQPVTKLEALLILAQDADANYVKLAAEAKQASERADQAAKYAADAWEAYAVALGNRVGRVSEVGKRILGRFYRQEGSE